MLQELNIKEIVSISGGSTPTPYDVGHQVGKACAAVLAAIGIWGMFK